MRASIPQKAISDCSEEAPGRKGNVVEEGVRGASVMDEQGSERRVHRHSTLLQIFLLRTDLDRCRNVCLVPSRSRWTECWLSSPRSLQNMLSGPKTSKLHSVVMIRALRRRRMVGCLRSRRLRFVRNVKGRKKQRGMRDGKMRWITSQCR